MSTHSKKYLLMSAYSKAWQFALVLLAYVVLGCGNPTFGQLAEENTPTSEEENIEEKNLEIDAVRPSLELGRFDLRELRFRSNVTAKILFSLHLALPHEAEDKTLEKLKRWQHRLRDQVIIALRKTEIKDLLEPDLSILRRNIMLRINRLLKVSLVEEVLITEFAFTTH